MNAFKNNILFYPTLINVKCSTVTRDFPQDGNFVSNILRTKIKQSIKIQGEAVTKHDIG